MGLCILFHYSNVAVPKIIQKDEENIKYTIST